MVDELVRDHLVIDGHWCDLEVTVDRKVASRGAVMHVIFNSMRSGPTP